MKKGFKFYAAAWAIALVLFNLLVFIPPRALGGYDKFGGAFFAGYIGITVAFVGQLVCAYTALKKENAAKRFYRLPLITVSYTALVLTLIVGGLCMAIPDLPNWMGALVCLVILAVAALSVVKASAAAALVEDTDSKVKAKTQFIRLLTADAESLCARATTDEAKAAAKKVYEAIRFSDPMSVPALADIEGRIAAQFDAFSAAALAGEGGTEAAGALLRLLDERSSKCKVLK